MAIRTALRFVCRNSLTLLPVGLAVLLLGGVSSSLLAPGESRGQAPAGGKLPDLAGLQVSTDRAEVVRTGIDLAHADCFRNDPFPSAKKCQACHEDHFREWSASQHAYAQLSPVFNAFSNKLLKLTNGTNGD